MICTGQLQTKVACDYSGRERSEIPRLLIQILVKALISFSFCPSGL